MAHPMQFGWGMNTSTAFAFTSLFTLVACGGGYDSGIEEDRYVSSLLPVEASIFCANGARHLDTQASPAEWKSGICAIVGVSEGDMQSCQYAQYACERQLAPMPWSSVVDCELEQSDYEACFFEVGEVEACYEEFGAAILAMGGNQACIGGENALLSNMGVDCSVILSQCADLFFGD